MKAQAKDLNLSLHVTALILVLTAVGASCRNVSRQFKTVTAASSFVLLCEVCVCAWGSVSLNENRVGLMDGVFPLAQAATPLRGRGLQYSVRDDLIANVSTDGG